MEQASKTTESVPSDEKPKEESGLLTTATSSAVSTTSADSADESTVVDKLLSEIGDLLVEDEDKKIHPPFFTIRHASNGICANSTKDNDVPKLNVNCEDEENGPIKIEAMNKLYTKYSQQCTEIEKLEKQVQQLHEQLVESNRDKNVCLNQMRDLTHSHEKKVQEFEKRLQDADTHLKTCKERATMQEDTLRKKFLDQEAKFNGQIEQLKKSSDAANREKDNAVVKYAEREKEILTLEASQRKLQQQIVHLNTERDALNARVRGAKNEKEQLVQVLHQKENEIAIWKRKHDDVKNYIQESELRVKLADKRVESVEEAHKETKIELEKCLKRLKESKEENAVIKTNYDDFIKQFRDAESKTRVEYVVQQQENVDQKEIHQKQVDELDLLKRQHKSKLIECEEHLKNMSQLKSELETIRRQVNELELIVKSKDETLEQCMQEITDCRAELENMHDIKRTNRDLERRINELLSENADLEQESKSSRQNAENMLELTQKLTDKYSFLQTENVGLSSKLSIIERENQELTAVCSDLKSQLATYKFELDSCKAGTSREINELTEKLEKANKRVDELNTLLEDERNQNRISKKKHAASLKELKSELSLLKRRLEAYESGTASQCSGGSLGDEPNNNNNHHSNNAACSRSPSMTSLDMINHHRHVITTIGGGESPNDSHHSVQSQQGSINCDHNQAMIEKIVKLQRILARRTEKIEFLEEHVKHMTTELQKKSRIIQLYVLREETGALISESADLNKAFHGKSSGTTVMNRVFGGTGIITVAANPSSHVTMSDLSPELSVQIMSKLQVLFEDTVLKNITLKENIQTLGEEIANLSRENRTLKLQLSGNS